MTPIPTYGKLYLFPTLLGGEDIERCIPLYNLKIIENIRFFVVEELRTARRFLRKAIPTFPIDECDFQLLNEHTNIDTISDLLNPIYQGKDMGLLSEAGLPCVADPGNELVMIAQQKNIKIIPLVGPSSILMALMASGLSGQNFVFHGYLPTDKQALISKIQSMEINSQKHRQAQLCIETPYRNNQLIDVILKTCQPTTLLCIAANITLSTEYITTKTVAEWKSSPLPNFHKQPAIFILQKK
ncbi:MAG TPA: SAM-dependent methyltransferase [Bacteroidales bacterium]|nr:SAM-dependent methyltransferase [Bacteroidales bacterium]HOR81836.1 SAM-dependent methyltransferase [Bacteroidales bacterium]HPJ90931.1 SAM-dependent methyltransferase [Bacteroidales bacterium]